MAFLTFIDDEKLIRIVSDILNVADNAIKKSDKDLYKNVIDPFSVLFEMAGFSTDYQQWILNEKLRQSQKSLSNRVGTFHEEILGNLNGWLRLNDQVDIVSEEQKIIAEIKNKHNTIKGSDRKRYYDSFKELVMPKNQKYKGYTAYLVEIIPKSPQRYNKPFTPSDASTGTTCAENEFIRVIDGHSFYALATGIATALEDLFTVLPEVIHSIKPEFSSFDIGDINNFFNRAFLG